MANDFTRGMAMMRKRDPQIQEDGFALVKGVAAGHVSELIDAYATETDHGLRCWLLELIGDARSEDALPFLAKALASSDDSIRSWGMTGLEKLDSKEARTLLRSKRQGQS